MTADVRASGLPPGERVVTGAAAIISAPAGPRATTGHAHPPTNRSTSDAGGRLRSPLRLVYGPRVGALGRTGVARRMLARALTSSGGIRAPTTSVRGSGHWGDSGRGAGDFRGDERRAESRRDVHRRRVRRPAQWHRGIG